MNRKPISKKESVSKPVRDRNEEVIAVMTPKERVLCAMRREPTDRVPIFMWFHPETLRRLAHQLEIRPDQVAEAMGNDVRQAWVNNNHAMEGIVHENEGEGHVDYWGIRWEKRGAFNQVIEFPLAGVAREQILDYRFPVDKAAELLANMTPILAFADTHFIGVDVSPCVFEMYWRLRGLDHALLDFVADTALADTMLGRCADFAALLSIWACEQLPLDWLWLGDDVAGQASLLMSPDLWRGLVKPHLKRLADIGARHGLPVAYHCCGALRKIIPDLIEIGVNVLNPVQCNCPGMDPFDLKREFGAALSFMGGVDTQGILPHGTPDEVRHATERLIEGMTVDGGGYILAASHTVPPETPSENIFAMYAAAGLSREAIYDRAAGLRCAGTA